MMDKTRRIAAASAVAGVLTVGIVVPAIAQDSDTTDDTAAQTTEDRRAAQQDAFAAALADELGLDTETVAAAVDTVRDQMRAEHDAERAAALQDQLDQAVADGELTQEQADAIIAAREAGALPLGGRGGRGGHGGHMGRHGGPGADGADGFGGSGSDTPATSGSDATA